MRWFLPLLMLFLSLLPSGASAQDFRTSIPEDDVATLEVVMPDDWTSVPGPFVTLHGRMSDYGLLLRLSNHGATSVLELAKELGTPVGDGIDVYLTESEVQFRRMQPGQPPVYADAVAYSARGAIFLRHPDARNATDEPLEQVLDHELVHVILGRAFAPERPPTWLQEGLAQVYAGQVGPETTKAIASGQMAGGLIDIESLSRGFPGDPFRARLAYAQSADFIGYIRDTYGEEAVTELVAGFREGLTIDGAVKRATGEFLSPIAADWRSQYESGISFKWTALANVDWLFGVCGILLVIAGVQRRIAFHRRLDEMEQEEALVDQLLAQMGKQGSRPR